MTFPWWTTYGNPLNHVAESSSYNDCSLHPPSPPSVPIFMEQYSVLLEVGMTIELHASWRTEKCCYFQKWWIQLISWQNRAKWTEPCDWHTWVTEWRWRGSEREQSIKGTINIFASPQWCELITNTYLGGQQRKKGFDSVRPQKGNH